MIREPAWLNRGRVPSLDGLRGASIVLVLWAHIFSGRSYGWPAWLLWTSDTGSIGVDVFFVMSGFLITLLLLREQQKVGSISIRSFYLRRVFRILPAYVTYAVVVGAALALTPQRLTRWEWARAATFTMSLRPTSSWYVAHFWSLSVEEHFYLLWPLLVSLLPKRWLAMVAIGCSFAAIPLRMAVHHWASARLDMNLFSPTRVDAIAVGCLLALVASSRVGRLLIVRRSTAMAAAAAATLILFLSYALQQHHSRIGYDFKDYVYRFIVEWSVAVILWAAVYHPDSQLGRALAWRPLTAVGVLSYSIYLWQQPFTGATRPNWMFRVPGNLLVIALAACASYYFVEQPFLRIKGRFETTSQGKLRSAFEASRLAPGAAQGHSSDERVCGAALATVECAREPPRSSIRYR